MIDSNRCHGRDIMITQLQVYISEGTDPYENLAIEQELFNTTPADCCTLYLWQNANTVVIGRNQNAWAECQCALLEQEGGKLARRPSGGGAVFHDLGNLNFTFLCATEHYNVEKQLSVIQTACRLAGIKAELSGRNDIVAQGRKFSGNAFYNAKGKSLHHGTILVTADRERIGRYLTPSRAKLRTKSVKSVKSRVINLSELCKDLTCDTMKQHMLTAFEQIYGLSVTYRQSLNTQRIAALASSFADWNYRYGSPIPLSVSAKDRFSWGEIEIQIDVKDGIIRTAKVYTDSMDWSLSSQIENALSGRLLKPDVIRDALASILTPSLAEDVNSLIQAQIL